MVNFQTKSKAGNMADETDLVPHGAIIQVSWEVHERKPYGSYAGRAKDKGNSLYVINGADRALANEYVKTLLELIKRNSNVSELEIDEKRLGESRLQGTSGPRDDSVEVFGMRGRIGGNPVG
jgi:hypothetical protein